MFHHNFRENKFLVEAANTIARLCDCTQLYYSALDAAVDDTHNLLNYIILHVQCIVYIRTQKEKGEERERESQSLLFLGCKIPRIVSRASFFSQPRS